MAPKLNLPRIAVILAAGKGTRMRSQKPKPLFEVAGRPMLYWVIEAAKQAGCERSLVVVGHQAERLKEAFADRDDITWVTQEQQLGTGHALAQAEPEIDGDAMLLVLNGDVPGLRPESLRKLMADAEANWGSVACAHLDDPGRLGRVIALNGRLERIVEAADATPEQLEIQLINAGLYALPAPEVFDFLRGLSSHNAQGELYLPDVVEMASKEGLGVVAHMLGDPGEALGINNRRDLARVHRAMIERKLDELMDGGVTILDPHSVTIEPDASIGADTVIHPGVSILGNTQVGSDVVVHQGCWLRNSAVADGVELHPYSVLDQARVDEACSVGPFARLRPASVLLQGSRVGNFVEVKNATLGPGAKAGHLSYLGDATVGEDVNIGAGVVTCNYDGSRKHRTEIGANAFVGSDTMLVAPVKVGERATTGAGSVITDDVPDGALGVGRSRQRNIERWDERKKTRAQGQ